LNQNGPTLSEGELSEGHFFNIKINADKLATSDPNGQSE
jgi:hypothetical protein